jgi:hypothetical protein
VIDDGSGPVELEVGSHDVARDGGSAPTVTIALPTSADDPSHLPLVTDADSPFTLDVEIADADGDLLTLEIDLVRHEGADDEESIPITDVFPDLPGQAETLGVQWEIDALEAGGESTYPAGDGWRVRVTASEVGGFSRTARSLPFTIGHGTTDLSFEMIRTVLADSCAVCHSGPNSEGGFDFSFLYYQNDPDGGAGAYPARGRIYRRAVLQATMPPVSAELIFAVPAPLDGDASALLREWLLAGAPE